MSTEMPDAMQKIFSYLSAKASDEELAMVRKAYEYASTAHAGQVRLSGEPYFSHPLAVAEALAELGFDAHAVTAGLLHDAVEDTKVTLEDVDADFGEQVADIVDGVTKISMMTFESKEEKQAENIRKMILAMSHDIRVPIVKLADRMHNMRTLDFQKPHRREPIARETMDIYAPLANRLGLHRIKLELENLSFKYLRPDLYAQITEWLDSNQVVERELISKIIAKLETILEENHLKGTVWGRIKHVFGIHKKMQEQNLSLEDMHDILAFRVIVSEKTDCYAMLGYVHAQWTPVPGRFKDYISMPKANGYQSLHTTVIGPEGERIEIQFRTEEMHRLAEHGVASHWLYKERKRAIDATATPHFEWVRDIVERQGQEADSKEFMHSLRLDLFKDEVFVFTPQGEVKELPEGATPLDFAFLIHSEVGCSCIGAKLNGKLVPLGTPLKNGDTVEIITGKKRHPSRDWLKLVKTSKARTRIQQYLRTEERTRTIALGRELLDKEIRKIGISVNRAEKEGLLQTIAHTLSLGSVQDLFVDLGYARHTPRWVVRRIQALLAPPEDPEALVTPLLTSHKKKKTPQTTEHAPANTEEKTKPQGSGGISLSGVDGVMYRLAKCCSPVPGDSIVGFIGRGGTGIVVHTANCPVVQDLEPDRLTSVQWDGQETMPFPARIHVIAYSVRGTLADIAIVLRDENVNISNVHGETLVDNRWEMEMLIEVNDVAHLYRTIDKLRHLQQVKEVFRSKADTEAELG